MLVVVAIVAAILWLPPPWGVVAVAAAAAVEGVEAALLLWWSKRKRAQVGAEALVGRTATVLTPCRPLGQVRVHGELWQARCEEGADSGDIVRIRRVDGLTLVVEPARSQ